MAGVVTALRADDHVRARGEHVDDLALALIPPLPPDDHYDHCLALGGLWPPRLEVVEARLLFHELELSFAGRAVAVLGEDDLGDSRTHVRWEEREA